LGRNFLLLWLGKMISQLGDKFYAIALAWWILQKTGSPSVMGLFLLTSTLPGILLGFFTGALTDRWSRKTILVVTDIIRGSLVLILSCLSMANALEVWQVFAAGLLLSAATSFFDPAVQAIVPEIVAKERLQKANGMNQMVGGICTVAGPMLGAFAVAAFGLTWVFLFNSISYFLSALFAAFMQTNARERESSKKETLFNEVLEGFRFVKSRRRITFVLKMIALAHLFMGSLTVMLPFLASSLSPDGVKILGFLEMMMGAGLVAGAVFMGLRKKAANVKLLLLFLVSAGACFAVISVLQLLKVSWLPAYLLVMTAIGACVAGASVFWQSLLQADTPESMTGRVFSVSSLIGNTSLPFAYALFGALVNFSSIAAVMGISGVCLILLCSLLSFPNRSADTGM